MGERLVFQCFKNEEKIATLYFHWSAYTIECYNVARDLIASLKKRGYSHDWTKEQIQCCLADILWEDFVFPEHDIKDADGNVVCHVKEEHGGIDGSKDENGELYEYKAFENLGYDISKIDFSKLSRSCGLISITERGMQESEDWAEAIEEFNFDEEYFTNNICYCCGCDEIDLPDEEYEKLPIFDPPEELWDVIPWDRAEDAFNWFKETYQDEGHYILGKASYDNKVLDGQVYCAVM